MTEYLTRPQGRIAYDIAGDGPLVVCAHGMGDLRSVYRFLTPGLVEAGYRVATMDLRGHGESDATFSAYDDVALATDLIALTQHLGGPAALVGNSMAAGAAVWAAAEAPALVSGLVLIGPFVRNAPIGKLAMLAFRAGLVRPWGPAVWNSYYPKFFPGRPPADLEEHRARIRGSLRRPEHWNLSPDDAFVRVMHPTTEGHVLVASAAREGPALYLAANGCEVTAVDEQPEMVRRVLSAAGAAGLAVRGYVINLGEWSPDVSLRAVVCGDAAFAGLAARERKRVIQILQSATLDGGVHLVETLVAGDNAMSIDELRSSYRGWHVSIDRGGSGSPSTFIARKTDS